MYPFRPPTRLQNENEFFADQDGIGPRNHISAAPYRTATLSNSGLDHLAYRLIGVGKTPCHYQNQLHPYYSELHLYYPGN